MKFFRTARHTLFEYKTNEEVLGRLKVELADGKLKNIHIKWATTCNKNEQQKDGKNNAEL